MGLDIRELALDTLSISQQNVRKDLGDLTELINSITDVGVLEPKSEGAEGEVIDRPAQYQAFPPDPLAGNGYTPSPVADTAEAALPQELSQQNLSQQNLLTITGELGPISPAQFMTLSGNACKVYIFCWNAEWVAIPLQQDRLPFGVGLQDIRTVLRVIHELWQHRCIEVRFDETEVDNPLGLRPQGKSVVLKTESSVQPIDRIFVRCVGFPEEMPEEVAQSLNGKLKRQIDYHQQRVQALQQEKAWWERHIQRQSAPWDTLIPYETE